VLVARGEIDGVRSQCMAGLKNEPGDLKMEEPDWSFREDELEDVPIIIIPCRIGRSRESV